jgi:hypothetical protein
MELRGGGGCGDVLSPTNSLCGIFAVQDATGRERKVAVDHCFSHREKPAV